MSVASILSGSPASISAPINSAVINCTTLNAIGAVSAGTVDSAGPVGNLGAGATVSILGNPVAGSTITTAANCELIVGDGVLAAPLKVDGPAGVGTVYDTLNNIPPGGGGVVDSVTAVPGGGILVAGTVADPTLAINWANDAGDEAVLGLCDRVFASTANTPYPVPRTGWYILTYSLQNSKAADGFSWVVGTDYVQLTCSNSVGGLDTNSYVTFTAAAPAIAGTGPGGGDLIENTVVAMVYLEAGNVFTFNPVQKGGAPDLGATGGLAVTLNPLTK